MRLNEWCSGLSGHFAVFYCSEYLQIIVPSIGVRCALFMYVYKVRYDTGIYWSAEVVFLK